MMVKANYGISSILNIIQPWKIANIFYNEENYCFLFFGLEQVYLKVYKGTFC